MHVDLLLNDRKCYTYENYAAKQVVKYFSDKAIQHRLVYLSDGVLQDYLFLIQHSAPNWLLSFVNVGSHPRPLCDMIHIPHFHWLEGSPAHALPFLETRYGKAGVDNQTFCQQVSSANVVYLPHGVEKAMETSQKCFDVVLFADILEPHFLSKTWEELFLIEEIAEIKRAIQLADPLSARRYFFYSEHYLKALKNLQIVNSFKRVKVDVFGEHAGNNWLLRLSKNIHLHSQLPYIEYFEVLRLSKIALIEPSSPWYLPALAAGCLPLHADEKEASYYLDRPKEREERLNKLKEKLLNQSWDHQINKLIKYL